MIESRYKIEYVLPVTEQPKSKKIHLLSYLLLIPPVIVIAGAIAYGLGYKNLPGDAFALFSTMINSGSSEKILTDIEKNIPDTRILPTDTNNEKASQISDTDEAKNPGVDISKLNFQNATAEENDLANNVILESEQPESAAIENETIQQPKGNDSGIIDMPSSGVSNTNIQNTSTQENDLPEDVILESEQPESAAIEKVTIQQPKEYIENATVDNNSNNISNNQAVAKIEEMLLKDKALAAEDNEQKLHPKDHFDKSADLPTGQLDIQEDKNKTPDMRLAKQKADAEMLVQLLDSALKNANTNDQNYIASLNSINSVVTAEPTEKITNVIDLESKAKNEKAIEASKVSVNTAVDYNNSISLGTTSKVDAIIAAMNTTQVRPKDASINQHAKLQTEINQIIKADDNKAGILYNKALKQESQLRSNEIRSIIVKKGETLWSIALRAYGNGNDYKKIIKANPQLSERKHKQLTEGQILRVPI